VAEKLAEKAKGMEGRDFVISAIRFREEVEVFQEGVRRLVLPGRDSLRREAALREGREEGRERRGLHKLR